MFDQLSTQKRLLIATAISILFFIAYDYFFIPKQQIADVNTTTTTASNAPKTDVVNDTTKENAPIFTSKSIVNIKGKTYNATIDELGRISTFVLDEAKFKNESGEQISLISPKNSPLPLEIRFSNKALNDAAFKTNYVANISEVDATNTAASVTLTQNLNDLILTKTITFYPLGSYDVKVELSKNEDYFITPGFRPDVIADGYTVHGTLIRKTDGSLDILEDGDIKGDERIPGADIVASSDRYYTTLFFEANKTLDIYMQKDAKDNTIAFIRGTQNFSAKGYIGPKDYKILKSIDPNLIEVIEYGWFTFIAKPMFLLLSWLHTYIGNWGWAIVAMTLIIRIVLFPLTYKGMVSMNKLKDLAPKMKEIQTKYKGDPQKINAHIMELYRKNGANPMGGCLPILLQIPIFFAIYRVLLNAIELKGAEWILWVKDLAIMDPYFVLPVLMGVTMFVQQKITPTNFTDPMQEKIMKFLPLIFTFFFVTFPAGLTLYWFINNLCSVVQQVFVNKIFKKHKEQAVLEKRHENN
ncbi:membrane protein insertase YidC [Campylobacter hyointestinalis]|uniref:membrane protein insertase YidC n=1 Tax=Campylobacter hyointestinalis TaxID=198 RepID=UPI000DCBDD87|nr:membrane protein insertase YidC [Campylobacter hyointestinalis]RAZ46336.1 membrane protein insertase YidC [Campylobacter hyointestinalis subsp. lawsonii]